MLTEPTEEPGLGLKLLRESKQPKDAIKPLRELYPCDTVCATQIAHVVDWANVYFLSGLKSDLIEDLIHDTTGKRT